MTESPITIASQQIFVGLVNLADYYQFITNQEGEIVRHIFESNVRDYQGHTTVNKEIEETLGNSPEEDFWWLNNGITIVASKATLVTGKEICITEPEIVNGLQTSTEIFNFYSKCKERLQSENRNILVRIIVPNSDESRDRIILATNSQTSIPKASLRATDSIHRQIEMFFKPRKLYYDRRKNYYKNQGEKADRIISVSFLAQCLMSILLQKPNFARARPSTLLTDDNAYEALYIKDQNLNAFYAAAYIGKIVDAFLRRSNLFSSADRTNILFYVIYYVVAKKTNEISISRKMLAQISLDDFDEHFVMECANEAYEIYKSMGGGDKVAKGGEFIKKVQDLMASKLERSK